MVKYYDYLQEMYWDSTDFLYSKDDSLFFRDKRYFNALTTNGKKVFWGRGNAWVVGGLAQLLSLIPEKSPIYKDYEELYMQMITKNSICSATGRTLACESSGSGRSARKRNQQQHIFHLCHDLGN